MRSPGSVLAQLALPWVAGVLLVAVGLGSGALPPAGVVAGGGRPASVGLGSGPDLPALDRGRFGGCVSPERWAATRPAGLAGVPVSVVVVTRGGDVVRMGTGEAWERTPPDGSGDANPADDVWTIGACSR